MLPNEIFPSNEIFPNLWNLFKTFPFSGERELEELISRGCRHFEDGKFFFSFFNKSVLQLCYQLSTLMVLLLQRIIAKMHWCLYCTINNQVSCFIVLLHKRVELHVLHHVPTDRMSTNFTLPKIFCFHQSEFLYSF